MMSSGLNPGSGGSMNVLPCWAPSMGALTPALEADGSTALTVPDVLALVHAPAASGATIVSTTVIH